MSEIAIGITTKNVEEVKSFAFHYPEADSQGHTLEPPVIRIDMKDGSSSIVKGDKASTLKVQLSSFGITDISEGWNYIESENDVSHS